MQVAMPFTNEEGVAYVRNREIRLLDFRVAVLCDISNKNMISGVKCHRMVLPWPL